ncbi:hypothetical protein ACOMHN_054943 [Nucella lapillus]
MGKNLYENVGVLSETRSGTSKRRDISGSLHALTIQRRATTSLEQAKSRHRGTRLKDSEDLAPAPVPHPPGRWGARQKSAVSSYGESP